MLSHQCFDFKELRRLLGEILSGKRGVLDGDESKAIIDHHLAAMDGPLACERIVDILEKVLADMMASPKPPFKDRLAGWHKVIKRRVRRRSKSRTAGPHKSMEHHLKKNPEIPIQDLRDRIARLQQLLDEDRQLQVEQIHAKLFRIKP